LITLGSSLPAWTWIVKKYNMIYQYTGKLSYVSDITSCSGKVKEKVTVVITADGRNIAMMLFDDKIDTYLKGIKLGDIVTTSFSIKSTEWEGNGKWYTTLFCIDIEKADRATMDK
jgi:Domain of unknown function (DUF3127)